MLVTERRRGRRKYLTEYKNVNENIDLVICHVANVCDRNLVIPILLDSNT